MRNVFLWIRDFVEELPRPARWAVLGGAILVAVLLITLIVNIWPRSPAEFVDDSAIDAGLPVQEVLVRRASGTAPHTDLDLTRIRSLVIAVDLDYVRNRATYFQAVILDFTGDEVFRGDIGETALSDGRFLLELDRRRFPSGEYTLEIEGSDQSGIVSVLSRGTFRVTR